ncbi:hypothetical protein PAAG_06603 [Paracoccidioides lutzii Pb01]|uniref:Uncharacterized protein n=1 Tax=Paracoccidioides lutzii (strain ATCC MYA-826 / Pb01) TaxID=502779 RepID=C1H762_PARBA|nr:hypothetical protein PAAG_06603 [Paracoccidioides lutzii Pb01]EEH35556.2 hypothetical protein PAAG_06603 [Paracoccidioides lutzii Pb01]
MPRPHDRTLGLQSGGLTDESTLYVFSLQGAVMAAGDYADFMETNFADHPMPEYGDTADTPICIDVDDNGANTNSSIGSLPLVPPVTHHSTSQSRKLCSALNNKNQRQFDPLDLEIISDPIPEFPVDEPIEDLVQQLEERHQAQFNTVDLDNDFDLLFGNQVIDPMEDAMEQIEQVQHAHPEPIDLENAPNLLFFEQTTKEGIPEVVQQRDEHPQVITLCDKTQSVNRVDVNPLVQDSPMNDSGVVDRIEMSTQEMHNPNHLSPIAEEPSTPAKKTPYTPPPKAGLQPGARQLFTPPSTSPDTPPWNTFRRRREFQRRQSHLASSSSIDGPPPKKYKSNLTASLKCFTNERRQEDPDAFTGMWYENAEKTPTKRMSYVKLLQEEEKDMKMNAANAR